MIRSNFFRKKGPDSRQLKRFITAISANKKQYIQALGLKSEQLTIATLDQMMENADDVVDGVIKVEMIFNKLFFGLFNSLVIKYNDRGAVRLMFYDQVNNHRFILELFSFLREILGQGIVEDERFTTFNDVGKVHELAMGRYQSAKDEILHLWHVDNFTVALNYKLDPLRQLLLSFTLLPEKVTDLAVRNNGTLISSLGFPPRLFDYSDPLTRTPVFDGEEIKFIDYEFVLEELEFGVFDRVMVRLFSDEPEYNTEIQTHLTYFSTKKPAMPLILDLIDSLNAIYGMDDFGSLGLELHNIDDIGNNLYWSGKSWYLNTAHQPWNLNDETQNGLYQISLSQDPMEHGLVLHVLGYNNMEKFELRLI
ncbi:hypothetical protein [Pedobacter sp. GR22-10]|uniref:hypothetical protein n=1 Tax=Pedobacter sp. GR22-10 TaxID=2994472 RepID=UPI002245CE4C|nr:hypothetical protein [Pedobacter sp. GR22-10]MCX2432196.1 hypothetical protein [Pedobacter sp. GR22-10]